MTVKRLVETSSARATASETGAEDCSSGRGKAVLTKFVEGEDVEAYLTTFQRLMSVYRVEQTLHLAAQLAGRVQQAYAALSADVAGDYDRPFFGDTT